MALFVAGIIVVSLVAQLLPTSPSMLWSSTPMWQNWSVFLRPATRMLEFVVGMLMARIVRTGKWINVSEPPAATLSVLAYAGSLFCSPLWSSAVTMVVPMSLLIAAVAVRDIEGKPTFPSRRTMVWLGNVSFAFYLVRWQVLRNVIWLFGGQQRALTSTAAESVVALAFPVALLCAWLLHACVEKPLQKRFSSPRRRPTRRGCAHPSWTVAASSGPLLRGGQSPANSAKNSLMSAPRLSGASTAGKWPPRGITV